MKTKRMKEIVCNAVMIILLFGVCFAAISGCAKKEEGAEAPPPEIRYSLSGKVISSTGTALGGVTVALYKDDIKQLDAKTSSNGMYTFDGVQPGNYFVHASQTGYTFGRVSAFVSEQGGQVAEIVLAEKKNNKNRKEEVVSASQVKDNGITVKNEYQTSVSTGGTGTTTNTQNIVVAIPKGTEMRINDQLVTGNVTVTTTPEKISEIPPASKDESPIGNVLLEPVDLKFNQPVEVTIPLDIPLPANIRIPVKKYENGQWKEIGTAVTDGKGSAITQVSEFGQISVQPKAQIQTQAGAPQEKLLTTTTIPSSQNKVLVPLKNDITFPSGLSEGIIVDYALSLIESKNGIMNGTSQMYIDLPIVREVAKPVAILGANSAQVWVQKCNLINFEVRSDDTITLTIVIEGKSYTITISYNYYRTKGLTECSREWIEHQGSI